MHRPTRLLTLLTLGLTLACVGALTPSGSAAPAKSTAAAPTRITVSENEFNVMLSQTSVPVGTRVVFTIKNVGKVGHTFQVTGGTTLARTGVIAPGATDSLSILFAKAGTFAFLCTVPGHNGAERRGAFTVVTPKPVTVAASEFGYKLSATKIMAGSTVAFRITNKGKIAHNFRIAGLTTPTINPGGVYILQVSFPRAGTFHFDCTLPGHASAGMKGDIVVVAPTKVTVTATDFAFRLSLQKVTAGTTVLFTVVNAGKVQHDFLVAGKNTGSIMPGMTAQLTVVFPTAGGFTFRSTLPGNGAAGMKGTFTVAKGAVVVARPTTTAAATTTAPATTPVVSTPPPAPAGPEVLLGDPVAGAAQFTSNGCGSCHTLAAAGSTGSVGPILDGRKPTQGTIKAIVQAGAIAGGAQMPAFNLSATDLNNLAAYVYKSTH